MVLPVAIAACISSEKPLGAANIRNLTGTIRVEAVGGTSGIHSMKKETAANTSHGYALNGMIAAEGQKGVVIKGGKKFLVK